MNNMIRGWLSLLGFFSALSLAAQAGGVTQVQVSSGIARPGETICLDIRGSGMSNILAMQFSVRWDSAVVEFVDVTNFKLPGQSINDFGFRFAAEGAVTFLYIAPPAVVLPDEVSLFTLCLRARGAGGVSSPVEVTDSPTNIEFIGILNGTEDIIGNYSVVGGSVAIPGAGGPESPFALIIDKTNQTNCVTTAPAPLRVQATGGIAPYRFNWSGPEDFRAEGAEIAAPRPGTYTVTATDAGGARLRAQFEVDTSKLRIDAVSLTDAGCDGAGNGSIALRGAGGVGAYTYRWSNGAAGPVAGQLSSGVYAVTVSDETGCSVSGSYEIKSGSGITLAPQVTAPACGRPSGAIVLNGRSAAGGLTYAWQDGAATSERNGLAPGLYAVTVSDAGGCSLTRSFDLSWTPLAVVVDAGCGPDDVYSATARARGGRAPYRFDWSTGAAGGPADSSQAALPGPGAYTLTVTDADGCTRTGDFAVAPCIENSPVWPGDADTDGAVNHFDLLTIGLAFGAEGPARPGASTAWQAQPAPAWNGATPVSGVNFKFADTDGNGRVDAADTAAIALYWGRGVPEGGLLPAVTPREGIPLRLALSGTPAPGQPLIFDIVLGDDSRPAPGVYGLAFSLTFDEDVITGARASFASSWMGTPGTDLLPLHRLHPDETRLDIAITRTDRQNRAGQGAIGRLTLDLAAPLPSSGLELTLRFEDVRLINAGEEALTPDPEPTQITLEPTTGVSDPALAARVRLFPNPAGDYLRLDPGDLRIEALELIDATGRRRFTRTGNDAYLDLRDQGAGLYWLRITTAQGVAVKAIVVKK